MKWCFKKTAISVKNAREVYRRPVAERLDCAYDTMEYKMMISLMLNIKLQWAVAFVLLENLSVIFTIPDLSTV